MVSVHDQFLTNIDQLILVPVYFFQSKLNNVERSHHVHSNLDKTSYKEPILKHNSSFMCVWVGGEFGAATTLRMCRKREEAVSLQSEVKMCLLHDTQILLS